MSKTRIIEVLKPTVKAHDEAKCVLCQSTEPFTEAVLRHVLENYTAKGKLVMCLGSDGETHWQEPEPFYKQHPEFKGKQE